MGKSKNRKDHRKKSAQRTLRIKGAQKKAQKAFIEHISHKFAL